MSTTVLDYLLSKGITLRQSTGKELLVHCFFNECDKDSTGKDAHLYINRENALFHCKKCDTRGNIVALAKHFGDDLSDLNIEGCEILKKPVSSKKTTATKKFSEDLILQCHMAMPDDIRLYLNDRGISNDIIEERKLGYGSFYGSNWITLPIRDEHGYPLCFKLRRDPKTEQGPKYMFYPKDTGAVLYGTNNLLNPNKDELTICEGEFDQMVLSKLGIPTITSTAGAATFKEEWLGKLEQFKKIFVVFDNDTAGKDGSVRLQKMINARYPAKEVGIVHLPTEKGKDVSEFIQNGGTLEEMRGMCSKVASRVDLSRYSEMDAKDIARILSISIQHDDLTKVIVFLSMLTAFTEDSQFNVLLNAPSSAGKSFIPLEIAKLFPDENVLKLQYVSQNAFFHETGVYDKVENCQHIYLDRRILIFIDQPKSDLLARLRPMLSHDEKVMVSKITDKNGQGGNSTKTAKIHGYPVAIFCTASSALDEQEATRFLLLSPEISQDKISSAINAKIMRDSDRKGTDQMIEKDMERSLLKERIEFIRNAHISDIRIENTEEVKRNFFDGQIHLQPRHQRDIGRYMGFIKAFALLNMPFRKREGDVIFAEDSDIHEANIIWKQISATQANNISPYLLDLYKGVVLATYVEVNKRRGKKSATGCSGISRKDIYGAYFRINNKSMSDAKWRQDLEPALIDAGLIYTEKDGKSIIVSPMNTEDIQKVFSN